MDDAPDFISVFSAVSANARTCRANKKVHEVTFFNWIANLGERSAVCDFFDAVHERAQVPCSNLGIPHEFHEIVDDYHRTPLNLHAAVVQRSYKQRYKDRKSGCSHFSNKRCR